MGKEREEIRGLMESLVAMSDEVGRVLAAAMTAFAHPTPDAAAPLREMDTAIDRLENVNDAKCLRIHALYQPEADDLRAVFMAMSINNELERIADHALNIAERAEPLAAPPPALFLDRLERMGNLAQGMLTDAITAFMAKDSALAKDILTRDDEADDLLRDIIQDVIVQESARGAGMEMAIAVVLAAKELERIADLCCNIAEAVVFVAEGATIKHHGEM